VAESLPLRVKTFNLQIPVIPARLNCFELLESLHLLAPAGEVVLTPGVALSL
jgi:hypothetical protein